MWVLAIKSVLAFRAASAMASLILYLLSSSVSTVLMVGSTDSSTLLERHSSVDGLSVCFCCFLLLFCCVFFFALLFLSGEEAALSVTLLEGVRDLGCCNEGPSPIEHALDFLVRPLAAAIARWSKFVGGDGGGEGVVE